MLPMNGNYNQYDPTEMFRDWIQKNGRSQAEFMKNFAALMTNQTSQTFNPLETLREVSDTTRQTQSNVMQNMSSMQSTRVWILCLTLVKCFLLL